jgi:hypothetical protein
MEKPQTPGGSCREAAVGLGEVVRRGTCPICIQGVYTNQPRALDRGTYYHEVCLSENVVKRGVDNARAGNELSSMDVRDDLEGALTLFYERFGGSRPHPRVEQVIARFRHNIQDLNAALLHKYGHSLDEVDEPTEHNDKTSICTIASRSQGLVHDDANHSRHRKAMVSMSASDDEGPVKDLGAFAIRNPMRSESSERWQARLPQVLPLLHLRLWLWVLENEQGEREGERRNSGGPEGVGDSLSCA